MAYSTAKRPMLGLAAAAVMSVGLVQTASAVNMIVKATVQNTLTATVASTLGFGQLFATKALVGASSSAVRSPTVAGTTALTGVAVGTGMTFMTLGGATRGEVSVAIPPNSTTPYTVTLGGLTDNIKTAPDCGATTTDGVLEMVHDSGNPAVPNFNVHSWVLAPGTGSTAVSVVAPEADGTAPGNATATATVTPAFGTGPSSFYIGATISTECVAGDYQDTGEYVGTLTIDVGY